jgi:DNA-binding MarR family transcriptional regulator
MDSKLDKLIFLSMQISKIMASQSDLSVEERFATMLQFHVLSFLQKSPQANLTAVADYLKSSVSSTTQLIERMCKAGYIQRVQAESDRRSLQLSLTEEGVKQLQYMLERKREKMRKIFSNIPEQDINELIRIQEKLLDSIKNN